MLVQRHLPNLASPLLRSSIRKKISGTEVRRTPDVMIDFSLSIFIQHKYANSLTNILLFCQELLCVKCLYSMKSMELDLNQSCVFFNFASVHQLREGSQKKSGIIFLFCFDVKTNYYSQRKKIVTFIVNNNLSLTKILQI